MSYLHLTGFSGTRPGGLWGDYIATSGGNPGQCLDLSAVYASRAWAASADWYVGVDIKGTQASETIILRLDGVGTVVVVTLDAAGAIRLRKTDILGDVLATITGYDGLWGFLELALQVNGASGSWSLCLEGHDPASASGVNLGTDNPTTLVLGKMKFDNLVVRNDLPGSLPGRPDDIGCMFVVGDHAGTDWGLTPMNDPLGFTAAIMETPAGGTTPDGLCIEIDPVDGHSRGWWDMTTYVPAETVVAAELVSNWDGATSIWPMQYVIGGNLVGAQFDPQFGGYRPQVIQGAVDCSDYFGIESTNTDTAVWGPGHFYVEVLSYASESIPPEPDPMGGGSSRPIWQGNQLGQMIGHHGQLGVD